MEVNLHSILSIKSQNMIQTKGFVFKQQAVKHCSVENSVVQWFFFISGEILSWYILASHCWYERI